MVTCFVQLITNHESPSTCVTILYIFDNKSFEIHNKLVRFLTAYLPLIIHLLKFIFSIMIWIVIDFHACITICVNNTVITKQQLYMSDSETDTFWTWRCFWMNYNAVSKHNNNCNTVSKTVCLKGRVTNNVTCTCSSR